MLEYLPTCIFVAMNEQKYPKITLKPQKERSVLNFHPWIFSGAIASPVKDLVAGTVVEVFDSNNKYLATGHFNHGSIMVRILSFEQRDIDESFWQQILNDAFELRKDLGFATSSDTDTFRLIHGEGDLVPGLIIDVYGATAVIQAHSDGMIMAIKDISTALQNIPGLKIDTIYNKSAETIKAHDGVRHENEFLKGALEECVVKENNHHFYINWKEGQKTGFFLDQRENRKMLSSYAKDKIVLNTFCYSGGFSIYALKAGAAQVDSVDSSKKAMEWTAKNVSLNFPQGAPHNSYTDDVFDFLKSSSTKYDIIVLDPPAFAKHLNAVDKAVIGYRNLNYEAIKRIKPGGLIFTFSCSQAVDKQLFRKTVFTAAAKTGRKVRVLHQLSQGPDHPVNLYHPEGEYLKGLILRVD